MNDYKKDFKDFEDNIWLNAASEGPLPLISAKALDGVVHLKSLPHKLVDQKFIDAQVELKESIGRLINVTARDVILANSASYGIHLLANGFDWQKGDEILLMQNDFPTNIIPWLALEKKGVKIVQIKPRGAVVTSEELEANITSKTKLFCISHVHTFTGFTIDVLGLSAVCKKSNIIFVLNLSQSVGTMPIDVSALEVDAVVTAGYKWLCGPYGVGFAWMKPELRKSLDINQAYWVPWCSEEDLKSEDELKYKDIASARKFDVFGTANFFNFVPFRASIDYFLSLGLDQVRSYHDQLIDQFIEKFNRNKYVLISPTSGAERSSLIVISHQDQSRNKGIFDALKERHIHPAFWKGNIRFSPHVYNAIDQIDQTLEALDDLG